MLRFAFLLGFTLSVVMMVPVAAEGNEGVYLPLTMNGSSPATPTPRPTNSPTAPVATPTGTTTTAPSSTPTQALPVLTATSTPTITPTPGNTPTPSNTPTPTSTATVTPTPSNSLTPTTTATITPTPSNTPTPTNTATITPTPSNTPTIKTKPSNTPTITPTPSNTPTPTNTATNTPTPSNTPTSTPTPSNTPTPTNTATNTPTPSNTPTIKTKPSNTPTPTNTATNTPTPSSTPTPTSTATITPTPPPTLGKVIYGLNQFAEIYKIDLERRNITGPWPLIVGSQAGDLDPVTGNIYYFDHSNWAKMFAYWDPDTFTNTTVVTYSEPLGFWPKRLAFTAGRDLYMMDAEDRIYSVLPDTGEITLLGQVTGLVTGNLGGTGDIAFAPDGTLYLNTYGNLYTVDLQTLAATPVSTNMFEGIGNGVWSGLTYCEGVLYGSADFFDTETMAIYEIDPVSGALTEIIPPTKLAINDLTSCR